MTADLLGETEKPKRPRVARPRPPSDHSPPMEAQSAGGEAGVASPPQNMLALIDRAINDPGVDLDKLERLLAFQEKLMARQAEIDFNEAKQRVLTDLAKIKIYKRKSVRYDVNKNRPALGQAEAFKYAPLEIIDEVIAPLLAREELGVSYTSAPRAGDGGGAIVTMTLKHKRGHFERHEMALPLDATGGKGNIQAMGSTLSYGRRYTLCMAFNIVVQDEDDDGNGGYIGEDQVEILRKLIKAVQEKDEKRDEAGLCRFLKVASIEEIPQHKLRQAISVLDEAAVKLGVNLDA